MRAVGGIPLGGSPSSPPLPAKLEGLHAPLWRGSTLGPPHPLACQYPQRGQLRPPCPGPTCSMVAGFLGPLSGELAAAEGVRVTDVLALELGRRGTSGIRARSLGFQPPGETEKCRDWGRDVAMLGEGTRIHLAPGASGNCPLHFTHIGTLLSGSRPRPFAQDVFVQGQPASTASHRGGLWGWHRDVLTSGGPGAGRYTSRGCW